MDRRTFLKATSATVVAGQTSVALGSDRSSFSVAFGGGAARGLAHIPVVEALDELGITPSMIAGTSMGAIVGAAYASGMSGREIREFALELLSSRLNTLRRLLPGNPTTWASLFSFDRTSVLQPETLMSVALPDDIPATFSELAIPLRIVAADFYRQEDVVIEEGPLHKAIGASAALPVFLAPVRWEDRLLIDGGFVNPTPFDILADQPGVVVAVDVTGNGLRETGREPSALETWMGSSQIALHSLVNERLKRIQPDLLVRPEVSRFASMEFHRIGEILAIAEQVKDQVKRDLGDLLDQDG